MYTGIDVNMEEVKLDFNKIFERNYPKKEVYQSYLVESLELEKLPPSIQKIQDQTPIRIIRETVKKIKFTVIFDALFFVYVIAAVITMLMIMTNLNNASPTSQMLGSISTSILIMFVTGVACFGLFKEPLGIHVKFDSDVKNAGSAALESMVFLIPIIIINLLFKNVISLGSTFQTVDAYNAIFSIMSALSEELIFSLFLTTVGEALARKKIHRYYALIGICLLFAAFHLMVYRLPSGAPNFNQLAIMTGLRFFFSLSYMQTKRISAPVFLHLVNNILANMSIITLIFGGLV
jgi:membrane protease YdiL (CAAX protease family)